MRKLLGALLAAAVAALHHDVWFWNDRTLLGGVLPVGLAYHLAYTALASATVWLLARLLREPPRNAERPPP
jgi:hypothetical protein